MQPWKWIAMGLLWPQFTAAQPAATFPEEPAGPAPIQRPPSVRPAPAPAPAPSPPTSAPRAPAPPAPQTDPAAPAPAPVAPAPVRPVPAPVRPAPAPVAPAPAPPPVAPAQAPKIASPSPPAPVAQGAVPVQPMAPVAGLPFAPPSLPAFRNLPPPPGYVAETHINGAAFGVGLGILAGTYIGAIVVAGNGASGSGSAAVPVFGPWIALSQFSYDCQVDPLNPATIEACQDQLVRQIGTVASLAGLGVGQIVGLGLAAVGLLDQQTFWVRADLAQARARGPHLGLRIGPGQPGTWGGVALEGRF